MSLGPVIGVLVGGQGLRMGGVAKGNLQIGGQSVLGRTVAVCLQIVAPDQLFLVGDSSAYDDFPGARLADSPAGVGPLGGLRALLLEAQSQQRDALALAVDMPFVREAVLRRLLAAPCEGALAPKQEQFWQPLFARYRPSAVLPAVEHCLSQKRRSMQSVFDRLGPLAERLALSDSEQLSLRDWDSPSDLIMNR